MDNKRTSKSGHSATLWVHTLFGNKILLIVILAAALRLLFLSRVPPSLNWDEVSMGYSAYSVLQTGSDEWGEKMPLFFRSYGEWKSAVYVYLLIPFITVFGMNEWAVRLPAAIAGIFSVYLTYLIGKKIYGEKTGLYAALFMAVSPWALMLSRPGFEANVALTLILAGVCLFLENKIYVSAVLLGLAPHTYNSAKIVVPLLILFLVLQSRIYRSPKKILMFSAILILFALPLLYNLLSGVSAARLSQVGVTTDQKALTEFYELRKTLPFPDIVDKILVNKATYTLWKVSDNWLSYFSPSFLLTSGGSHRQHSLPYHGVLYITEAILCVIGLMSLKKGTGPYRYLPVVMMGLGFIPAALTRDTGHVLRSILTIPGWQLAAGFGFASLSRMPLKKWAAGILTAEAVFFLVLYFGWYPKAAARDWQYGHREVAEYLREHEGEYSRIVMTKWFGEPHLFLAFYNSWDPLWYQQVNTANLRYEAEGRMWLDQLPVYSLGKYTFTYIDWGKESQAADTLYIGKFDDFPSDAKLLKTITYPDGSVAFNIVAGTK